MSSSRTATGFWDDQDSGATVNATIVPSSARQPSTRTVASAIKDDWEDEDEVEEDLPTEEKNKQIWEDANTKVHHPMPDVILARNTAISTPAAQLPPQGVFDQLPKMKILKRPTATSPTTPPAASTDNGSALASLKERETRYNAARERIFGSESPANSSSSLVSPKTPTGSTPSSQVKVAREPRGPGNESRFASRGRDTPQRGFEGRSNTKPRDTPSSDTTR